MYDFIDKARQVLQADKTGWAVTHFKNVFEARRKLQAAYAKSHIDIDNVENLLATFDMARLIRRLSDMPEESTKVLPTELRFMIMRTLEQSIRFRVFDDSPVVEPPTPYDAFVELLAQIEDSSELSPTAIITFNYDLALEYALRVRRVEIDYGLNSSTKNSNAIPIYKLHGSLNWTLSGPLNEIEVFSVQQLPAESYWRRYGVYENPLCRPIDTMELLHGPDGWGNKPIPEPLIVPPTWSKEHYHEVLKSVWYNASKALSSAENIFIIGYSLPPSDQFFRSFFALSTISESLIERLWVFDPSEIAQRYHSLVGAAISSRDKFKYEGVIFSDAIASLSKSLGLDEKSIRHFLNRG
jgi:hypothetical protein